MWICLGMTGLVSGTAAYLNAQGSSLDSFNETADHGKRDIGLQQGSADVPHGCLDVLWCEFAIELDRIPCLFEAATHVIK